MEERPGPGGLRSLVSEILKQEMRDECQVGPRGTCTAQVLSKGVAATHLPSVLAIHDGLFQFFKTSQNSGFFMGDCPVFKCG